MIRKEGEKKKKEEKEKLKKTRKRRKTKTISQRKRTKRRSRKNNTSSEKIHFLCLKRMMRKMTWTMILWFSQILPPVITSLKAHFHDYQQLKQWKVSI